jgi:hypothetical protein
MRRAAAGARGRNRGWAMTDWRLKGQYFKNCNCIAHCPCDTVGVPAPQPFCEGLNGMHIDEGYFGDERLDGLDFAFTYHFPGALHEGNGTAQPFITDRARPAQRDAILAILSGKHGGPMFEIFASLISNGLEPQFVPIEWSFDKARRHARLVVKGHGEAEAVPLVVPATGAEQRVIVQMPTGFEYHEIDIARTAVLRGTGAIRFEHKGTNSNLALVDHSPQGLA